MSEAKIIVNAPMKSAGVSVLLTFFFGGFGLLYSSIIGGIIMSIIEFINIILCFFLIGFFFLPIIHLITIAWGVVAVNKYNRDLINEFNKKDDNNHLKENRDFNKTEEKTEEFNYTSNFHNKSTKDETFINNNIPVENFNSKKTIENKNNLNEGSNYINIIVTVTCSILVIVSFLLLYKFYFLEQNEFSSILDSTEHNVEKNFKEQDNNTSQNTYEYSDRNNQNNSFNSIYPGRFPIASERYLAFNDISGLNKYDLKIMRNEIFARHGYIFKTPELRSYFFNQNWYYGQYDDVFSNLSEIEKQNIRFIERYE